MPGEKTCIAFIAVLVTLGMILVSVLVYSIIQKYAYGIEHVTMEIRMTVEDKEILDKYDFEYEDEIAVYLHDKAQELNKKESES